mgnify:CR=1 FL=1
MNNSQKKLLVLGLIFCLLGQSYGALSFNTANMATSQTASSITANDGTETLTLDADLNDKVYDVTLVLNSSTCEVYQSGANCGWVPVCSTEADAPTAAAKCIQSITVVHAVPNCTPTVIVACSAFSAAPGVTLVAWGTVYSAALTAQSAGKHF